MPAPAGLSTRSPVVAAGLPAAAPRHQPAARGWFSADTPDVPRRYDNRKSGNIISQARTVKTVRELAFRVEPRHTRSSSSGGWRPNSILHGWDLRAISPLIVTSATYPSQTSKVRPHFWPLDPEKPTGGPRALVFGCLAESVRDNALAIAGR